MNVYDFDGTIYRGDSTINFYLFCTRKNPLLIRYLPRQMLMLFLFLIKKISKNKFKEEFFCFLNGIKDVDNLVSLFWKENRSKIYSWYLNQCQEEDVIISASPEFLLRPELSAAVIASPIHPKTGKMEGENCYGEEKVRRFRSLFGDAQIDEFYSDTLSDEPMARQAKRSFIVCKGKPEAWPLKSGIQTKKG